MGKINLGIDLEPVEHQDPSRTKHVILKRPHASWSQSVFSVPFGDKIVPNRDYHYEGLSVMIDGENWHILDALAVGIKIGDRYAKLSVKTVTAYPWKMVYRYGFDSGALEVGYYLLNTKKRNSTAASISLHAQSQIPIKIVVEPLADIRHMYSDSCPEAHWGEVKNGGLLIGSERRGDIALYIKTSAHSEIKTLKRTHDWRYKLGAGYRRIENGRIVFAGRSKSMVSLGEIENSSQNAVLILTCGRDAYKGYDAALKSYRADEAAERKKIERITSKFPDLSVGFRAACLTKFGMFYDGNFFHEAGDFWFRSVWMRDEFEGLLSNFETFFTLRKGRMIKEIILSAFRYHRDGIIPNRPPNDYNSADATLLAYITAGRYAERTGDAAFARKIVKYAEMTLRTFSTGNAEKEGGPPVMHYNGLISVVPWHSWTDGKRTVCGCRVPIRIPVEWENELIQKGKMSELNKPKYFLPEINAQWVCALRAIIKMCELSEKDSNICREILAKAEKNFKTVLQSGEFLYNVVDGDGKKDATPGSPAVVALSLLEDLFDEEELRRMAEFVKANLLVYRKGLPFGILVRKSEKQVYLADDEYHEGVVWPRDTPYLIRLLRRVGDEETIEGLLKSNLEHQMDEGFVFYNSELFSPDDGAMTPVKNPVQFWSQWVDPYLIK